MAKDTPQVVKPQTVSPLAISDVRAPAATPTNNELLADVKKDEARATQFGLNPDAAFRASGSIRTVPIFDGRGKDKVQTGTKQVFRQSRKGRERFEKAQADFESRGGNKSTAETVSRGSGGGAFQSVGDFGGGGIKIGGVKPLGG